MLKTYQETAVFEHKFWLQVLGDHARFILDSLAEREKGDIEQAKRFKQAFDVLLKKVSASSDLYSLTMEAEEYALSFRKFKLSIIKRHLTGDIKIHLSPTFINHMVNELEEYLLVMKYLKRNEVPPIFHELHHHMLWLMDAAGHAGAISDDLDGVEKRLKKKSRGFEKHFEQFYLKSVELTGYLRANVESFPALRKMNEDIKFEIDLFRTFLHEIEELELSDQVLGTFSALMADHMMREECYYLMKIAESTNTQKPACDPAKPRLQEN